MAANQVKGDVHIQVRKQLREVVDGDIIPGYGDENLSSPLAQSLSERFVLQGVLHGTSSVYQGELPEEIASLVDRFGQQRRSLPYSQRQFPVYDGTETFLGNTFGQLSPRKDELAQDFPVVGTNVRRLGGQDGRVKGRREVSRDRLTVAELLRETGFDRVSALGEGTLGPDQLIVTDGERVKAVYQDYRSTVLTVRDGAYYRPVGKDVLKSY